MADSPEGVAKAAMVSDATAYTALVSAMSRTERKLACVVLDAPSSLPAKSLIAFGRLMQIVPSPMETIQGPISTPPDPALPRIGVAADRRTLAKRLWRGIAADGREFGFQLEQPLQPGDAVWVTATACYVIAQQPEPVLEIQLPTAADEAAAVGWAVGNLHFPIEAQPRRLLAPDDTALRQSLVRAGIAFREAHEVFRPHRFAAGAAPHSHAPAGSVAPQPPVPVEARYRFIGRPLAHHG